MCDGPVNDRPGGETGSMLRAAARAGWNGLTVGRARGFVQANLFLVPATVADEFAAFVRANSQACPLLAIGRAGDPALPSLGAGIDVRTDLPAYLLHTPGEPPQHVAHLRQDWRSDFVPFAIGCWFGAEAAIAAAGIRMRHAELGVQGGLFRTTRDTVPAGRFKGPVVVSMRPFAKPDVPRVIEITAALPRSHGAPLHRGDPAVLGITAPDHPDWGEPLPCCAGEEALFWACGLTALMALEGAGVPFASHAPGAMLVTDLPENVT
ncbi:D-glutamate cyclase family protein [Humitalea sp. 24SJ18S-53]|uniref:D-glutamate cyclase family protein n=1 Tax=Humitalea sp. 24SJ18S-53 TaxID=3422307 RepID=UPI003D678B29